jgi:Putative prokaryotic signal transducing protein
MTPEEHDHIRQEYGKMSEIELMDVARTYDGLQPEAQTLLREEFTLRSLEPPLIEEEAEFAYQHLVTVAKYRDLSEAIVARAALEQADIPCFLKDENMIRMQWGFSNFLGGLRLQVPEPDAARAQEVLNAPRPESIDFAEEPGFEQPTCPKCGSADIDLEKPSRTALPLLWFFSIPIPSRPKHPGKEVWHCLNCGCTWLNDDEPAPTAC